MNSIQLLASKVNRNQDDQQGEEYDNDQDTEINNILQPENDENNKTIRSDDSLGITGRLRDAMIFIFKAVLFFPNLLFLRPLLYFWYVITFPLRFLEEKVDNEQEAIDVLSEKSDKLDQDVQKIQKAARPFKPGNTSLKSSASFNQEYDDLATINSIKTNTTVATEINSLKSPTSPSSYMANVFAKLPKVLFSPLNFNPAKHQRKVLILDLDETLIHSLSKTNRMSTAHMVEVKVHNLATLYYVYKRPFCDEFLRLVSNWYDVYIFTASAKEYADPVINWLERDYQYFKKRFYREHCTLRKGAGYIKDLSILEIDLSKVILVDNSPISYSLNYENALDIEGWIDDPTDNELLQLLPLLNALRFVTDVRYILGLKNGAEAIK